MIAWPDGKMSPSAKNGTSAASATDPVASSVSNVSASGRTTRVAVMIGPIEPAGDGAPSHETTAAVASNPGRARTNAEFSSGTGNTGSTSCVRTIALTTDPCVAVSQSGGSTWPCNAQTKVPAATRPTSKRRYRQPPRMRYSGLRLATTPAHDPRDADHHEDGKHRDCLERDVNVMQHQPVDADESRGQSRRQRKALPGAPRRGKQRCQCEAREECNGQHPWEGLREFLKWQDVDRAQRPLSVATAKTVRAMISRSSATDCRLM